MQCIKYVIVKEKHGNVEGYIPWSTYASKLIEPESHIVS